jgi:hypothetical protein
MLALPMEAVSFKWPATCSPTLSRLMRHNLMEWKLMWHAKWTSLEWSLSSSIFSKSSGSLVLTCYALLTLIMLYHSLKNSACIRPFSSYRASFEAPLDGQWRQIRLPWKSFQGFGPGASENALDVSTLIRTGVVAIGKPMKVVLGISSIRFYKESATR